MWVDDSGHSFRQRRDRRRLGRHCPFFGRAPEKDFSYAKVPPDSDDRNEY